MMDLFDMGKYDFYVWSSIAVFILAIVIDFISINSKQKQLKRLIKAKAIKAKNRQVQNQVAQDRSKHTCPPPVKKD